VSARQSTDGGATDTNADQSQRGRVDNRAARRRAAAAAKRTKDRSRRLPGAATTNGRVGAGEPSANAPLSGAIEKEALVVSHAFDSGEGNEPYAATVRLTGRRVGIHRTPGPQDTFVQEDRVDGIAPGSGLVSVTSWIYRLEPGEWTVSAELLRPGHETGRGRRAAAEPIPPAAWSWPRWTLAPGSRGPVRTRWAMVVPLARMPGVIPGSFTLLGALGILVALIVQSAILARDTVPLSESLVVSLIALASGLLGAKAWYAILHPGPWRRALLGGWAVDGFLVVASTVAVALLLALELPVGRFLDATAPGIFFAVAIGRLGCFFTGCCAGRCTSSRWGIWSFDRDRRIGARRVPTQLLESAAGLVIGLAAGLLVLGGTPLPQGVAFAAAVVAYFLVRQGLLRLRAERRDYIWRRSGLVSGQGS
jgi:phosphatidylglycerol:prolipoprotein diacylglycerol transferase